MGGVRGQNVELYHGGRMGEAVPQGGGEPQVEEYRGRVVRAQEQVRGWRLGGLSRPHEASQGCNGNAEPCIIEA